jgi:flagellar L-ring protein precursor FlgH
MKKIGLFILSISLISCAGKKSEYAKPYNPTPPEIQEEKTVRTAGSLYTGSYNNLFSDSKAFTVGDVITIKVIETIAGQTASGTTTQEQSKMDLNLPSPTIMGKKVPNKTPIAGITESNSDTYKGTASTNRSSKLIASISARVVKVYPNGNLFIVGKKVVKVNDDYQTLVISGIVRPTDILQDNSVDSSRISDLYVEYNGEGYIADSTRPGWLAQFLKKIWPF